MVKKANKQKKESVHLGLLTTSRIPSLFSAASLGARVQEKFIFLFFPLLQSSSQYHEDVFSVAQRNKETRQTNGDRYKLFVFVEINLLSSLDV